jgi:hypothetical protein
MLPKRIADTSKISPQIPIIHRANTILQLAPWNSYSRFEHEVRRDFDQIVWAAIDGAFAEPVTRTDDTADYAPTQIIAELFRSEGYDGVAYKSAFGEDGFNVALFDLNSAKQVDGELHRVTEIKLSFEQHGNPYYITADAKG